MRRSCWLLLFVLFCASPAVLSKERTQQFDSDPKWDALNNRSKVFQEKTIIQSFGYGNTHHAGGAKAGEIGGLVTPAAEPAYYGKVITRASLDEQLTASGTLACPGEMPLHGLIGFFNSDTLNEWRTPNTIAIRLQGRGKVFYAYLEYMTSKWRAGGDSPRGFYTVPSETDGKPVPIEFKANDEIHHWTISYDPVGNKGSGCIVATIDNQKAICNISREHRSDGATFNRFGLLPVMKQWDSPGEVWLDDININGQFEDFSEDPRWDAKGNRRTYVSSNVRPRFDFGFSPTNFAQGRAAGELGGLTFRGEIRESARMAYYGDRLENLQLNKPIRAAGKIALRRAVSDSGTLIGFFHSNDSVKKRSTTSSAIPTCFLGVAIEGPSSEGFFVYPAFRNSHERNGHSTTGPSIFPDGSVHEWTLDYSPPHSQGDANVSVTLDGKSTNLSIPASETDTNTTFDRFGIVSTWIDGNGQNIYFDDLAYTCVQE